jgi:hypothetical protein
MKTTIISMAAMAGLTGLVPAISLDLAAPPLGVTVNSPAGVSNIFGVQALRVNSGTIGIIDFGFPVNVTFDIVDLDTP